MGSFLIGIAILLAVAAISLTKRLRAVRSLRTRCAVELSQLQDHLTDHHLIVLHLVDSLPVEFLDQSGRADLTEAREQAEKSIRELDAANPKTIEIRNLCGNEQELFELVESVSDRVFETPSIREIQSVLGCLNGLAEVKRVINDATSTYNASVITYRTFLESPLSSLVERIFLPGAEFCVVDLGQYSSGSSSSG